MPDPYREPIEEKPVQPSAPAGAVIPELPGTAKEQIIGPEKEKPAEQAIAGVEQPVAPTLPAAALPNIGPTAEAITQDAQKIRAYEKNQQLKSLVDLAFSKGVNYAAEVARNLDNPYLMDEFHDTLVDELHKELIQKGKLEEI